MAHSKGRQQRTHALPKTRASAVLRMLPLLALLGAVPLSTTRCATYGTSSDDFEADAFAPVSDDASLDSKAPGKDASGDDARDAANDSEAVDATSDAPPGDASNGSVNPQQGACAAGMKQVGEYATWGGKVNVHKSAGGIWSVDSDCSSGANVNTVAYCQKFWPAVVTQVQLPMVTPVDKPFTQGGGVPPNCGGLAPHNGVTQFACCAP